MRSHCLRQVNSQPKRRIKQLAAPKFGDVVLLKWRRSNVLLALFQFLHISFNKVQHRRFFPATYQIRNEVPALLQ